jgi:hypothetical protein
LGNSTIKFVQHQRIHVQLRPVSSITRVLSLLSRSGRQTPTEPSQMIYKLSSSERPSLLTAMMLILGFACRARMPCKARIVFAHDGILIASNPQSGSLLDSGRYLPPYVVCWVILPHITCCPKQGYVVSFDTMHSVGALWTRSNPMWPILLQRDENALWVIMLCTFYGNQSGDVSKPSLLMQRCLIDGHLLPSARDLLGILRCRQFIILLYLM